MPDTNERLPDVAREMATWRYTWACVACGLERTEHSSTPPHKYAPGRDSTHVPGTRPDPARNVNNWDPPPTAESYFIADPGRARAEAEANGALTEAERDLVRDCWVFTDSLEGRGSIRKRVSAIRSALAERNISALIAAVTAYVGSVQDDAESGRELAADAGAAAHVESILADLARISVAERIRRDDAR